MQTVRDDARQSNGDQAALWNGVAGQGWVAAQALLDQVFQPFEDLLVAAARVSGAGRVLDVGCGSGGTTLAVARVLGAGGRCTGVDISAPMIAAARTRAGCEGAAADFVCADAQVHAFEPAGFDLILSHFGVMFFDDPVTAFSNLRAAARKGGALRFIAWRSPAENPFMTVAERAAAPLLPNLPARDPDAPGQFAFADRRRVHGILDASGWADIAIEPVDRVCRIPENELERYFTLLGPLGRVLPTADAPTRAKIVETVRAAFDPYVRGDEVRLNAACWMVGARASQGASSCTP